MKKKAPDPDMLEEYDFSGGVRGKYAQRYAEGTNVVVIDPDVAEYFPDHDSVNEALRGLAAIIKRQKKYPFQNYWPKHQYPIVHHIRKVCD